MKTVVFDLDGTLADTSADLLGAANSCFQRLGHGPLLDQSDAATALHGGRAMLRLGFSRLQSPWDEDDVNREYPNLLRAYADDIDNHTRLYAGAHDALVALKSAGMALSICTNKPEALAETLVQRLGIRHFIASLIGADTLAQRKPDPAPLIAAILRAGGDLANAILVGDTKTDLECARAAGIPIVLVGFGPEGQGVRHLAPDAVLMDYRDLPGLALRLLP